MSRSPPALPAAPAYPVTVTRALGATSVPTYVFVHPADRQHYGHRNSAQRRSRCRSLASRRVRSMTVEAHAFSQGADITSSVGPFTWSADNPTVVTLIPMVNTAYNFRHEPGHGDGSRSRDDPDLCHRQRRFQFVISTAAIHECAGHHFARSSISFETCPIQTIESRSRPAGSQQTGQTTFVTSKGYYPNCYGHPHRCDGKQFPPQHQRRNRPQQNPTNLERLSALRSRPLRHCAGILHVSTPSPGSGTVTASCSPPTCNIGFPSFRLRFPRRAADPPAPSSFSAVSSFLSCQQLIPDPVYSSPTPVHAGPQSGDGAISGLIPALRPPSICVATSTGCANRLPPRAPPPFTSLSTAKASTGPGKTFALAAQFSPLRSRRRQSRIMGSDYGAELINPAQFGTSNSPFTALGTVTGKCLAVSNNGTAAVFSDTIHTPNQVYIVNTANPCRAGHRAEYLPAPSAAASPPTD